MVGDEGTTSPLMVITGEVVAGSGQTFTLANTPVANSVALYGGGIRLILGSNADYTISGAVITIVNAPGYSADSVVADYLTASSNLTQSGNDILSPFALTTLQRVKDILFDPNKTVSLTGASLTSGSANVTGITVQTGKSIQVGQTITGTGIPTGATIAAIISATQITLSANATATNTGQTLTVIDQPTAYDAQLIRYINWSTNYIQNETNRVFVQQTYVNDTYSIESSRQDVLQLRQFPVFWISSFQWRAGTPTNPSWTSFIGDQYELINPQTDPISGTVFYPSGQIRVYGVMPALMNNMIRASYVAGYPVDWTAPEDHNKHWLPGDITNVCENLVVRRFTRRTLAGKSSQALEGATISWRNEIDAEDLDVLGQYRNVYF
jgi:hypothetical protein